MLAQGTRMSEAVRDLVGAPGSVVGGRWVTDADATFASIDPATEDLLGTVPSASAALVDDAVRAARKAFDEGPWPRMSPRERSALLRRLTDTLKRHGDELAQLGVLEIGSPLTLSRGLHAAAPLAFFDYWADMALRGPGGRWEEGLGIHEGPPVMSSSILFNEPVGVVAAISAYNFPLLITSFKIGAALAAGCTAVLMPSPRAARSSIAFMRILEEADLPPGIVNLVVGEAEAGRALSQHPDVDMVSFTGSVAVGRQVMLQAAGGLKKVVLELGGKSPNLLLPGADVEAAVGPSILRFTRNSGQGCGATTRTFVHRDDHDRFVEAAKAFMAGMKVGDPWDETTDLGPLIRGDHRDRVQGYLDRAYAAGGAPVAGGLDHGMERGFFLSPVLVGGLGNDSEICQEELFAPVGAIVSYDTVDEAVELANASRYGLNANVWGPMDEAMRVARRLRSGTVTLNGGGGERPDAPWGGYGESGIGYDRGEAGFREFFQVKHVQWPLR